MSKIPPEIRQATLERAGVDRQEVSDGLRFHEDASSMGEWPEGQWICRSGRRCSAEDLLEIEGESLSLGRDEGFSNDPGGGPADVTRRLRRAEAAQYCRHHGR